MNVCDVVEFFEFGKKFRCSVLDHLKTFGTNSWQVEKQNITMSSQVWMTQRCELMSLLLLWTEINTGERRQLCL